MTTTQRALMLFLSVFTASASAALIPVGTETFNLDFTSSIPYSRAQTRALTLSIPAGDTLTYEICSDFNAGGICDPVLTQPGPILFNQITLSNDGPGFLDGLFSVQLTLVGGAPAEIASLTALVLGANNLPIATQTLIPRPVPEPATLALLGIGVAGLAASRRRKLY